MADISQTMWNPQGIPIKGVKTVTADTTLTREDAGKIIVVDAATKVTCTLPATRRGYTYHFLFKTLSTGQGHAISPQAADTIFFKGAGTFADNKDMEQDETADAVGDHVTLVGDGNNGYYAISVGGTFVRET